MYNSWQRDPASVHAVSFRVFSLFGAHIDCRRVLIVKVASVITRFSSIFLILVVGCLFPQQLILSTSLSCAFAKKSCVGQSVHGWLLSTSRRRRRTSSYGRPRRRQTHWRSLGCSSHYQKLSGKRLWNVLLVGLRYCRGLHRKTFWDLSVGMQQPQHDDRNSFSTINKKASKPSSFSQSVLAP